MLTEFVMISDFHLKHFSVFCLLLEMKENLFMSIHYGSSSACYLQYLCIKANEVCKIATKNAFLKYVYSIGVKFTTHVRIIDGVGYLLEFVRLVVTHFQHTHAEQRMSDPSKVNEFRTF